MARRNLVDGRERRRAMELRDLARQYAAEVDPVRRERLSRLMEGFEPGATAKVDEQVRAGEPPDSPWPAP